MRIINKTVPDDFNYFLIGDNHTGTILMDTAGIETMMHMMNTSYDGLPPDCNFGWHSGDHMEARTIDHPYFQLSTAKETTPSRQVKACIKLFDPIKDKLIGMNMGNHPRKLMNYGNYTLDTCKGLGIKYGTFASKVVFKTKGGVVMHRAFHTHGSRTIKSSAGTEEQRRATMGKQLKDHLRLKFSDCILKTKGHSHKLLTCSPISKLYLEGNTKVNSRYTTDNVVQDGSWIHEDDVWYVNTGSFLKLYADEPLEGIRVGPNGEMRDEEDYFVSGYAEEAEYDPMELGFAIARYREGKLVTVDEVVLSGGQVRIRTNKTERVEKVIVPVKIEEEKVGFDVCSVCNRHTYPLEIVGVDIKLCLPCMNAVIKDVKKRG